MQRLVNRTAEYYWQEIEFQSMVYDRTTFILANTFADGPFPSGITFKGDFSIVNDSFNHLNMTLNRVELNFETFSGRKPKFSKQYWRYIFDHGEATLRSLRIIKYQIEDFIIPNYMGAALTQEMRPLTEFKVVGCEVKEVKERAFKNFTQLEVLDLSDNHLTTLPENVFSRNINLQKILLANNQISFLTKTIFDGLPNLLLINLRKNKLTAVPAIPRHTNRRFQPMVYLMADNSIHCRCSLIWVLHELTFHHNLEIEATCSDPTMVRGMPIIEGFTRMDKEACYRVLTARKEDDSTGSGVVEPQLAISGASSSSPAAQIVGASDKKPSALASPSSTLSAPDSALSGKSETVGAGASSLVGAIPAASAVPVVVPAHQESAARALETLISAAVAGPQAPPAPVAAAAAAPLPMEPSTSAAVAAVAAPVPAPVAIQTPVVENSVAPVAQLINVSPQTVLAPASPLQTAAAASNSLDMAPAAAATTNDKQQSIVAAAPAQSAQPVSQ